MKQKVLRYITKIDTKNYELVKHIFNLYLIYFSLIFFSQVYWAWLGFGIDNKFNFKFHLKYYLLQSILTLSFSGMHVFHSR